MTNKQFEELEIGDIVTRTGGPNKDVLMSVTNKCVDKLGNKFVQAIGIEPNSVYNQMEWARDENWTSGSMTSFKLVRKFGEGKTMHRSGRPSIDNPRTFQYRLRLNAEEEKQLTFLAKELNKPKSEIIRELIRSASHTLYYGYDAKTRGDDVDD